MSVEINDILSKIVNGELTMRAALEQAYMDAPSEGTHRLAKHIGKNVFIRTVTHHYTGCVTGLSDGFITLNNAAWVADDGKFSHAMKTGELKEVEPYPDELLVDVGVGTISDISRWNFPLPRVAK